MNIIFFWKKIIHAAIARGAENSHGRFGCHSVLLQWRSALPPFCIRAIVLRVSVNLGSSLTRRRYSTRSHSASSRRAASVFEHIARPDDGQERTSDIARHCMPVFGHLGRLDTNSSYSRRKKASQQGVVDNGNRSDTVIRLLLATGSFLSIGFRFVSACEIGKRMSSWRRNRWANLKNFPTCFWLLCFC